MVTSDKFLITHDLVRQTLDALINLSSSGHKSPLDFLFVVDLYLIEHDLTFTSTSRYHALSTILADTILAEYHRLRLILHLPRILENLDLESAINIIRADAEKSNADLMGWCWLYFRYVASVYRIAHQDFAQWVNVDERTLRRYQYGAVQKLTDELVSLEADARDKLRRKRLLLQLPRRGTVQLVGRDAELDLALKAFADVHPPHIVVNGPAGIGKSVFVEYLITQLIDSDQRYIDQIVWIDRPMSIQFVEQTLREQLLPEQSNLSISEYFLLKRVVVVLDDVLELQKSAYLLEKLLYSLSNAVLLITSDYFQTMPGCSHIVLSELSQVDVQKLITLQMGFSQANDFLESELTEIYKRIGGNPAAVILTAQNLAVFNLDRAVVLSVDMICSGLYSILDTNSNRLWFLLSLFGQKVPILAKNVVELWPATFNFGHLDMLIQLRLIEVIGSTSSEYFMSNIGRHFIQNLYRSDDEFQASINELILSLDFTLIQPKQANAMIETILMSDWLIIHVDWQIEATRKMWRINMRNGRWSTWRIILEKYSANLSEESLDLALGLGICLRCLAQWVEAKEVFESIVDFAGRVGLFAEQYRGRLELAVLLRFGGDYDKSLSILNQLKSVNTNFHSDIAMEEVEVMLDQGEAFHALQAIATLPKSPRMQYLQLVAEVANHNENPSYIRGLAEQVMVSIPNNTAIQSRIHVLLGRSYEQIKEMELAKAHLSLAISIQDERDNDPYGMARTQSNLAALLLQTGDYDDAQNLLETAEHIQRVIKDHIGLAATQHNLALLRNRFAS